MQLTELKVLHVSALLEMAASLEIENTQRMRKQELMFAILKNVRRLEKPFSVTALWKYCLMALVSYALLKPPTWLLLMIFISLLHRSVALTCTLVIALKVKYVHLKMVSVTLL